MLIPFWRSTLNVCLLAIVCANQAATCAEAPETAAESFSVVLLPDTQNYSEKYPGTYVAQAPWIRQQAKEDNMVNFTGNTEFFTFVQKLDEITELIEKKDGEIQKIKTEYNLKESDIISAAEVEEEKTPPSVAIEEEVVEEQE